MIWIVLISSTGAYTQYTNRILPLILFYLLNCIELIKIGRDLINLYTFVVLHFYLFLAAPLKTKSPSNHIANGKIAILIQK